MYLTRAFLNPNTHAVQLDARDPVRLHKTVMLAFPDNAGPSPRLAHGVLHRLDVERDDRIILLVQSTIEPVFERWPAKYVLQPDEGTTDNASALRANPAIRNINIDLAAIEVGRHFLFRLRANTTRKVDTKSGADGQRRNGRRVPVRGDEARLAWLVRHGEAGGFTLVEESIRIAELGPSAARSGKPITVAGALFDGALIVQNADLFRSALHSGIGSAKAYGFGLLSVKPTT